jgi:hypothetical protein
MDSRLRGNDEQERTHHRHCEPRSGAAIQSGAPRVQAWIASPGFRRGRDDEEDCTTVTPAENAPYRRINPNRLNSNHVASELRPATIVARKVPLPPPDSGSPPVFIPKKPVTNVAGMNKAVITESR